MKKKLLRIVLSIVALALLCTIFVSCGDDDTEQTEEPVIELEQTFTDSKGNVITLDKTCLNLFYKDVGYVCALVLPKEPTEIERTVALEFKTALKKKTGRDTKFYYDDDELPEGKNVVLIGNTSFAESQEAYQNLQPRQSVAKIAGNKLVIAFQNLSSGKKMISHIMETLSECDKTEVKLKLNWTADFIAKPGVEDIPKYEKSNLKTTDCGNDNILMTSQYNSVDDFKAYCEKISDAGFEKVNTREVNGHIFVTYMGEIDYVYAYYAKDHGDVNGLGSIKVVAGPKDSFAMGDFTEEREEKYTPNVSVIGAKKEYNNGQGYVFRLPDGRFIIHDGGVHDAADKIFEALKAQAPDPNNIVIAAWFVSHPHGDHQWVLERFLENRYGDKTVTLQRIIFNYADASAYKIKDDDNVGTVNDMYSKIKQYASGTQIIKAHTGQEFKFGSVSVEILYTVEDYLPGNLDYVNTSSMVVRINIGGQKMMMLADSTPRSASIIKSMWGSYVKSDVVQLAHHGIWGASEALYADIQADIVLWPTQKYCAKAMLNNTAYNAIIEKALSFAEDLYVADDVITVIDIPFATNNNKSDVLSAIKNSKGPEE